MKPVTVNYTAADNCAVVSRVLTVSSNEPGNGSQPDWVITNDHLVQLRAEKGTHTNRIYTIAIKATDASGNSTTQTVQVGVAHSNAAAKEIINAGDGYNEFKVEAIPNPSRQYFTLLIHSNSTSPVNLRVQDAVGRLVEIKAGIGPSSIQQLGLDYRPGIYFIQLVQGKETVTLKLIRQAD